MFEGYNGGGAEFELAEGGASPREAGSKPHRTYNGVERSRSDCTPPLSQTAFSSASQFTTFSFSYPPTPTPVNLHLCSVILSAVIKELE